MAAPNAVCIDYGPPPLFYPSAATEGDHDSQCQQYYGQWTPGDSAGPNFSARQPNNNLVNPKGSLALHQGTGPGPSTPSASVSPASSIDGQDVQLQDKVVDRSSVNENTTQAQTFIDPSRPYEASQSVAGQKNPSQKLILRCHLPGCQNTSGFKHKKDLKRHMELHQPPQYFCGCCCNGGDQSKGFVRKDKLLEHLRKKHQFGTGIPPLPCPEEDCHNGQDTAPGTGTTVKKEFLFATDSCVAKHLRRDHPATKVALAEIREELLECDCCREDVLLRHEQSRPDKHTLESPMESTAKRGKQQSTVASNFQSADISSVGPYGSWWIMPNMSSSWFIDDSSFDMNGVWDINGTNSHSFSFPNYETTLTQYSLFENIEDVASTQEVPLGISYTETLTSDIVGDVHPVDFLAILKILNFVQWEKYFYWSNGLQASNTKPLTYNGAKETVTLVAKAAEIKLFKEKLEWAMSHIANPLAKQWKPDAMSGPSPQASITDVPRMQVSVDEELSGKIFAIQPKDNKRLVQIWMKSILPSLPGILSRGIGKTYTASLVRRGQSDFTAVPYIQIESPCIPDPDNQASIANALTKIWRANRQNPIQLLFTECRLSKLNGGPYIDTGGDDSNQRRLHFNLNRPLPRPGMGASLGLMCSGRVSGTLGVYIMIDGKKWILTSDHFVQQSLELADTIPEDQPHLVSPSRVDRARIKECLEQTERDFKAKGKSQWQEHYGDRDIPPSELVDLRSFPPTITDRLCDIKEKLEQVKQPDEEYILGNVYRRSKDPRISLDHQAPGLDQSYANFRRQMDWAICKVNNDRAGENRSKYQSNEEAIADDYVHESDRANGDICHEVCDIDPGSQVYYFGHKSGRRDGKVNGAPMQVSKNGVLYHEWFMTTPEEQSLELKSVQGDSGALVIRKNGNMAMGLITEYAEGGRLLFTPIKDIFADIKDLCHEDVSLPTVQRNAEVAAIPISTEPLCFVKSESAASGYPCFSEDSVVKPINRIHTEDFTSTTSSTAPAETLKEIDDNFGHVFPNSRRGSFSSLPSLTTAPASPIPMSPVTPPADQTASVSDNPPAYKECCAELSEPGLSLSEDIGHHERPRVSNRKTFGNRDFGLARGYFEKKAIERFDFSFVLPLGCSFTRPISSPKELPKKAQYNRCAPHVMKTGLNQLRLTESAESKPITSS